MRCFQRSMDVPKHCVFTTPTLARRRKTWERGQNTFLVGLMPARSILVVARRNFHEGDNVSTTKNSEANVCAHFCDNFPASFFFWFAGVVCMVVTQVPRFHDADIGAQKGARPKHVFGRSHACPDHLGCRTQKLSRRRDNVGTTKQMSAPIFARTSRLCPRMGLEHRHVSNDVWTRTIN